MTDPDRDSQIIGKPHKIGYGAAKNVWYPLKAKPDLRFQLFVWQRGDCWEWRGRRSKLGYGLFSCNGDTFQAHRYSYEMAKGDIPPGLELDHLCRHPWCVKPSHLEAVTHRENLRRSPTAVTSILARATHCPSGHAYEPSNIRYRTNEYGNRCRQCLTCYNKHRREVHAKARAARALAAKKAGIVRPRRWTYAEDQKLLAWAESDAALTVLLGRSVRALRARRSKLILRALDDRIE